MSVRAALLVLLLPIAVFASERTQVVDAPELQYVPLRRDEQTGPLRRDGSFTLPRDYVVNPDYIAAPSQPPADDAPRPSVPYYFATPVGGTITASTTWRAENSPYVVHSDVRVQNGATLTIEPGTIVKFTSGHGLYVLTGATLIANGTASRPIVFTSIRDDSAGGDTNADFETTQPGAGDWASLAIAGHVENGVAYAAFGSLTHVIVRYGHQLSVRFSMPTLRDVTSTSMNTALYLDTPPSSAYTIERLTLTNSGNNAYLYAVPSGTTLRDSILRGATGIAALQAVNSAARLYHNSIDDNGPGTLYTAVKAYSSPLVLQYNSLTNNRRANGESVAIDNCCMTIDARNNWWGSSSGPEVAGQSDTGGGSRILQNNVQYADWLGKPFLEEHKKGNFPWSLKAGVSTDVATGNFYLSESDLSIATIGFPLEIVRTYNNKFAGATTSALGVGWTWTYGTRLDVNADLYGVVWERADGAKSYFKRLPDGTYASEDGIFERLAWDAQHGKYRLTFIDQTYWLFDTLGRLTEQVDQDGNTTAVDRDGTDRIVSIIEPAGRSLVIEYDGAYIAKITDPLQRTIDYTRGAHNAITSVVKRSADGTVYATATYTYTGPASALTSMTDDDGNVLTQTFDAQQRVATQQFNGNNTIRFVYGPATDSETGLTFPAQTTGVFDTRGRAHVYYYTKSNKVYEHDREQSVISGGYYWYYEDRWDYTGYLATTHTDIESKRTLRVLDWNSGLLKQLTEPGGRTTTHQYDRFNNLVLTSDHLARVTKYEYDGEHHPVKIIDARNGETLTAYYPNGLRHTVTDPRGIVTTYTYDDWGYVASVTNGEGETTLFSHDSAGRKLWEQNPQGHRTTYTYDGRDNVLTVTDPLGNVTTNAYDAYGRKTFSTDAESRTTTYAYDRNALWKTTDAKGGVVELVRDRYAGNVIEVRDANGHATHFTYDDFNRRTSERDANGRVFKTEYLPSGRIARTIDAKNEVTNYTYDIAGQLTRIQYADGLTADFTYDGVGNRTSMVDWTGTTSWVYDALNRVVDVQRNGAHSVGYVYDDSGNLRSLIYGSSLPVQYTFDNANRMKSVTDWQSRATNYTYDSTGRIASVTYPNAVVASFTYDNAGRTARIAYQRSATSIAAFDYTYDKVGNRLSKSGETYQYDELHRLTRAQYPNGDVTTYTYDAAGNRLSWSRNGVTYPNQYDAADQLTWDGAAGAYTWDANGQLLSRPQKSYVWNARQRLQRMTDPAGITEFLYDADGNRVRHTLGSIVTDSVVNALPKNEEVLIETANGAVTYHVYGHDLLYSIAPDGPHYLHGDALGSVSAVSNASGTRESSFAYDVFGSGRNGNGGFYWPSHRFAGEQQESQGMVYLRARYYDPDTGRFLSRDPFPMDAMDTQSVNRYVYVKNNPTNYVDPSGEWIESGFDLAFIAYDLFDMTRTRMRGQRVSATQKAALAADLAGLAVPFATGGGFVARSGARASHAARISGAGRRPASRLKDISFGEHVFKPDHHWDAIGSRRANERWIRHRAWEIARNSPLGKHFDETIYEFGFPVRIKGFKFLNGAIEVSTAYYDVKRWLRGH